jgi:hypothetical protein
MGNRLIKIRRVFDLSKLKKIFNLGNRHMNIKLKMEVLKVFLLEFELSSEKKNNEEEKNESKQDSAPKHPGGIQ